jgi:hypothetical protein
MFLTGINMWRKVTFGATALCLAWSAYEVIFEEHEVDEYKAVPYRAISIKPLPWGDGKTRTALSLSTDGQGAHILLQPFSLILVAGLQRRTLSWLPSMVITSIKSLSFP